MIKLRKVENEETDEKTAHQFFDLLSFTPLI